jgi:hypothetical protein
MSPADSRSAGGPSLVRLRCATWREFVESYADDLTRSGLYVATSDVHEPLSMLEVQLELPDGTEIPLQARVVHTLPEEQARAAGKSPGIGLEILDLTIERRQQVLQLIEFARWQGASSDPNASFVRTLLEISPSLPASQVGSRLSQLPAAGTRQPGANLRAGESQKDLAALGADAVRHYSQQRLIAAGPGQTEPSVGATSARRQSGIAAVSGPLSITNMQAVSAASTAASGPASSTNTPAASRAASSTNTPATGAASDSSTTTPAAAASSPNVPVASGRPVDPLQLKLVLTNFAHRHYDAALRVATELLAGSPQDPQLLRWQAMCNARIARARNDEASTLEHYDRVLAFEPENREARDFVRTHRRTKRLNSIPFGRYFTKKK